MKSKLKRFRKMKGLSQKTIAEKLCMARSTYSKLESGKTSFKTDILARISSIYEVPASDLLDKDEVLSSNSNDFSLMLSMTEHQLSEKLLKVIPFDQLSAEHLALLKTKGLSSKQQYENTPLNGRIFSFGPKDVFKFMMLRCGMEALFNKGYILEPYWKDRWSLFMADQERKCEPRVELDERDYFVVFFYELITADCKELFVQFAERDFPEGVDEFAALDLLKAHYSAIEGDILCYSIEGYCPHTLIYKPE